MNGSSLAERVLARDPRAIARAMSLIENESADAAALVAGIFAHTGRAYTIGVTGPPGAGKSTLVERLITHYRDGGKTVGVIAVDPTSPFTGGAVLGDRVRMQQHAADPGVFVRSMATRGHLGGIARATADVALVLDAAGWDLIIVETVGVGQGEVDIVRTADVSLVVLVPGTGDEIQALKAGLMEIADIFVVNKSDREGADRLVSAIEGNLSLQAFAEGAWRPPIVKTQATTGDGIDRLAEAIDRFRASAGHARQDRQRAQTLARLRALVAERLVDELENRCLEPGELDSIADRIVRRQLDPYSAATELLQRAQVAGKIVGRRSDT